MEGRLNYLVVVTPEAEKYYLELLSYLYQTHNEESADKKSSEILALAMSLSNQPHRGRVVEDLKDLGKNHRFLVYSVAKRKTVKIIYFILYLTVKQYNKYGN